MAAFQPLAFRPEIGQPVAAVRMTQFYCEIEQEGERLAGAKLDRISRGDRSSGFLLEMEVRRHVLEP